MNDWEYGGGPQRMGVLKSVDHGNSWSYLGHVCFPGIDPHAGLALADPSPIIINNEIVLFFFELNTHDEATRIMGRATPPLNDGLVFSIPTVAFSHPDLVFGPYVLRFHDNTYRMYMGTMPGTLYDYEGIISASSSDGSTFILDQDVLTIGGLPGALLVPPGPDDVRLYVSTGNIESFVSQNGLTNFTADKPTPLRVRNAGGAHPIKLQYGNLPYQYFFAFVTAAYAARESITQPAELSIILTATSDDTVDWNVIPIPAILGIVPGVVELPDENGTLLLYFIDFWWNK